MVIVDSSVWIDAFNQAATAEARWLQTGLSRGTVGLTSLILCEVLRGVRFDQKFRQTRKKLLALPVYEDASAELAVKAAENFRTLQRRGITVRKTIDCLIATYCMEEGHELLHRDSDFRGLKTSWACRLFTHRI